MYPKPSRSERNRYERNRSEHKLKKFQILNEVQKPGSKEPGPSKIH